MDLSTIMVWNVRGLNKKSRRDTISDLVAAARPEIVCLQETKIQDMTTHILLSTLGFELDGHVALPATGTRGGALVARKNASCKALTSRIDNYSVLFQNCDGTQWWFTGIYGPQLDEQKILFLEELRSLSLACPGPWAVAGDFNLIYRAADKNNPNVDRAMMGRFHRLLNDVELKEIELLGRRYTWSNERTTPMLVRLDRVFCTADWEQTFPDCLLQSTAAGISDHCPLLLTMRNNLRGKPRFHFEAFWPKLDGFQETVLNAWSSQTTITNPMERLDAKLRATSWAFQAWSQKKVGNVKNQLEQARELLHRLDIAQDHRGLSAEEGWLRRQLKQHALAEGSRLD